MGKLFRFTKKYRLETIAGPFLKFLEALMETFVPFIMSMMINKGINTGDRAYIIKMGLLLVFIAVLGWIFAISAQYFCASSSMKFGREIRLELYKKIMGMEMEDIDRFTIPSLITRTTNDVNRAQTGLNLMLRLILRIPFIVIGAIVMSGVISPKLLFVYISTVPLITVFMVFIVKISMPYYEKIQKIIDNIGTFCRENIVGVRSVRAFRMQKREVKDFDEKTGELYKNQVKAEVYNSFVTPVNTIIINIGIIFILIIGAKMVNKNALLNGDIIALVNYLIQILVSVERTCALVASFNKANVSAKRINEVLDFVPEIHETAGETVNNNKILSFENVCFSYGTGSGEALKNISFELSEGESLGIIGGTGSGKTTLIKLLQNVYPITSGRIVLFDKEIGAYTHDDICRIISVVPQKAQLFKGTIRENLTYGAENADDNAIESALENSASKEFVDEKEGRLDFEVEYGGRNLSGGQKQRLTIARAFVKGGDVLIMDDSTSALDFVTEAKIRKYVLSDELDTKLKIIVSQRVSAVAACSKILVLDDGEAAGFGTNDELLSTSSVYREIYLSQTGELLSKGGDNQ